MVTTTKTARRCAIYTRISLDKTGEALGVQRQLDECLDLAERLGWEIVDTFTDNDISAYSGKRRDGFEDLLEGLKNNRFDSLIVWDTTRLYRRLKDLVRLLEVAVGTDIRTVSGGNLDLSTSTGRMLATILGGVAAGESEHKGERQRSANKQKAEAGRWKTANRCFGYTSDGQPLEPEASAYRRAVMDVLEGKSIQQVAREWNAAGLKTTLAGQKRTDETGAVVKVLDGKWNSPRVRRLLVNPRYAGLVTYRGKVLDGVEATWPPLVDADTHKRLVLYVSDPSRVTCTAWERKYIGSGLYLCGKCGGKMKASMPGNASRRSGPNRKTRAYVCRDHAHLLRQGPPLDDYVENAVLERLAQPDAQLLLANSNIDIAGLQDERATIQSKYDNLAELLDDGTLDGPGVRRKAAQYKATMAAIDRQLADATRTSPAAALIASGNKLRELWETMTPTVRAQVIDEIATVTIQPVLRRGPGFDPAYVAVEWKHD